MPGPPSRITLSRRALLTGVAALPVASAGAMAATKGKRLHIAVVGAGAFGGWTALTLLRKGARVTLVDAWGPGNSRASSSAARRASSAASTGRTAIYTAMAARALELWRENEARWKKKLYTRTGALWMVADAGELRARVDPALEGSRLPVRGARRRRRPRAASRRSILRASSGRSSKRRPDISLARRSCADVLEGFLRRAATTARRRRRPGDDLRRPRWRGLRSRTGRSWRPTPMSSRAGRGCRGCFPRSSAARSSPTRQEVFYFGTPERRRRGSPRDRMPVWVETPRFFYGIPGNERRGFKIADDARGGPLRSDRGGAGPRPRP